MIKYKLQRRGASLIKTPYRSGSSTWGWDRTPRTGRKMEHAMESAAVLAGNMCICTVFF
jgi:hypothetical protein